MSSESKFFLEGIIKALNNLNEFDFILIIVIILFILILLYVTSKNEELKKINSNLNDNLEKEKRNNRTSDIAINRIYNKLNNEYKIIAKYNLEKILKEQTDRNAQN